MAKLTVTFDGFPYGEAITSAVRKITNENFTILNINSSRDYSFVSDGCSQEQHLLTGPIVSEVEVYIHG